MNFDRPSLLSDYLPSDADWGIEEHIPPRKRFDSTTTSELSQPPFFRSLYQFSSPSLTQDSFHFEEKNKVSSLKHDFTQIQSNTGNFRKYIRKYLAIGRESAQLREKFNYNLVVSNLLDDTLVLSKNEQAMNSLKQMRDSVDHPFCIRLTKNFDYTRSELQITNIHYRLIYPRTYRKTLLLVDTVLLIVYLLKQRLLPRQTLDSSQHYQLFKLLLIMATKIVKFQRAAILIYSSKTLRSLDDFMLSNCQINKDIITSIITLKEFQMFSFLDRPKQEQISSGYPKDLAKHLNTTLRLLLLNMKHSISALLPFSNGEILEKYCQINNVQMSWIFEEHDESIEEVSSLEILTSKLGHFNNLRRFFICQLLTIHDPPLHNFFISKIRDYLPTPIKTSTYTSTIDKLKSLQLVFQEHTAALEELHSLNKKFHLLFSPSHSTDFANDNILSSPGISFKQGEISDDVLAPDAELNLNNLINKLQSLTTSLKYFKKYSRSVAGVDDAQEHDERMSILHLFNKEINSCADMYNICVQEYESDFASRFRNQDSNASSQSSSQRNSYNKDDHFSLKSFRTSSSSKKKLSSPIQFEQPPKSLASKPSDKKYKRMSTGLQLGLLTVLEEPRAERHRLQDTKEYLDDDKYDGVSPSVHGTYNQSTLDALTKRNTRNSTSRYSMNSVNSNVSGLSDLIASTHMTTTDDDIDQSKSSIFGNGKADGMSKEELQAKLEESLQRIYSLENEKKVFIQENRPFETPGESIQDDNTIDPIFSSGTPQDAEFLTSLEKTLKARHT